MLVGDWKELPHCTSVPAGAGAGAGPSASADVVSAPTMKREVTV